MGDRGALLVSRRPGQPIGWLLCAGVPLSVLDEFAFGYAYLGLIEYPGSLPFTEGAIIWQYWDGKALASTLIVTLVFLLFPTGRPLSPRWGYVAWVCLGASMIYTFSAMVAHQPLALAGYPFPTGRIGVNAPLGNMAERFMSAAYLAALSCTLAALISLFIRLRRSRGMERLQLKWIVFSGSLFVPVVLLVFLGLVPESSVPDWVDTLAVVFAAFMLTLSAVASAFAFLRYRLWDIDVIIRRTHIYRAPTSSLAQVYFGSAIELQNLLTAVVTVISTLIIAALFSPLHRRIQDVIDRRFYRQKYDAAEILARFSATANEQVELYPLSIELLHVVEKTLQLEKVSPWVKVLWLTSRTG